MSFVEIDWTPVEQSILDSKLLMDFDLEEIFQRVQQVFRRYGKSDFESLKIQGIEEEFLFQRGKGFIDLWGFNQRGMLKVIDWKTTGSINENWEFRERYSKQGCWYIHALKSIHKDIDISNGVEFEARGVVRSSGLSKSIQKFISVDELERFDINQAAWEGQKGKLVEDIGFFSPWPQNFPDGCQPFGPNYRCEFFEQCIEGDKRLFTNLVEIKALNSYSSEKEFRRCPERYRNLVLQKSLGMQRVDGDEANWGKVFHLGVAEVWRQMRDVQNA